MKRTVPFILAGLFILSAISCKREKHFISDKTYRKKVEQQFEKQRELAKSRSALLFTVMDQDITQEEKEALQFLYAFMPLSDLADYDGDFYLKNVRASLAARDTFSWGNRVPEEIFRHFVLPVRVNNENLDSARWVFFMELKDRIRNMAMSDAVLEVNHWCHEKVTYRGTDVRTSSPLSTMKTAYGRCGEESTFTVAALRSVGIPARQCYTPRWAHGDDNHAWVEVWVNGKWHYIGACEPEPVLDMAWFTGPAKRAMLVNTNVFGDYQGPEDILVKDPRYTRINILPNYADTRRIFVKIISTGEEPVDSAVVEFQLYNYAEFYPLTKCCTDKNGLCSFLTGYGDLLVWAAKEDRFGYRKITVKDTDTVLIRLSLSTGREYVEDFDFVPPPEQKTESTVSDSLKQENARRLAFEDKIRGNYEQTFIDSSKTYRLAANLEVNPDSLWNILKKSRGNWREIIDFISTTPPEQKRWVFPLLDNISGKDLRDVNPEVLSDQVLYSWKYKPLTNDESLIGSFILSPRVDNEFLKSFKAYFQEKFEPSFIEKARKDPAAISDWIKASIRIDNDANYARAPLTPVGVYELKVADAHSRDILFVALCRSFGIPSRLEPASKVPQYSLDGQWKDVYFDKPPARTGSRGTLVINNDPANDRSPEYYIHYTLEKYNGGFFRSLDYESDPVMKVFPARTEVIPGYYLVVTGNRVTGGTVMARLAFFNLEAGMSKDLVITLRKDLTPPPVLGTLDLRNFIPLLNQGKTIDLVPDKGTIIAWLEPDKEPAKHFIADLKQKRDEFTRWGGNILFLFRDQQEKMDVLSKNSDDLPRGIKYLVADPGALKMLGNSLNKTLGQQFPVVAFINKKSEIIYFSEGYRIGTGDDLLKYFSFE